MVRKKQNGKSYDQRGGAGIQGKGERLGKQPSNREIMRGDFLKTQKKQLQETCQGGRHKKEQKTTKAR